MGYLPLLSYASQGDVELEAERHLATPPDSGEGCSDHRETAPCSGVPGEVASGPSRDAGAVTSASVESESKGEKDDPHSAAETQQREHASASPWSAKTRDTNAPSASGSVKESSINAFSTSKARDFTASTASSASSAHSSAKGKNASAPSSAKTRRSRAPTAPSASGALSATKQGVTGKQGASGKQGATGKQSEASEAARVAAALRVQRRAVLRLQRHLLELPWCTEGQLAAACCLLTGPELDDVAVERSLAQRCGNLLCGEALGDKGGSRSVKIGQLKKISTREGAVHDARVLARFCSSGCMRAAQAAVAALPVQREGLLSAHELARVLVSVGCLPQGAAGTPSVPSGTPQVEPGASQGAGEAPQGTTASSQCGAHTLQGAAGAPQGGNEGVSRGPGGGDGSVSGGASAVPYVTAPRAGSVATKAEALQTPAASTPAQADICQKEEFIQDADSSQGIDLLQGSHANTRKGKARAKVAVKGNAKGKGTASAEQVRESSVMSSVKEKWGDIVTATGSATGTGEEGGRGTTSEGRRDEEKREGERSEGGKSEEGRRPWEGHQGGDSRERSMGRGGGDGAEDSQVPLHQIQGGSDAVEGYIPARRVPSHSHSHSPSPSHSHSHSHSCSRSPSGGSSTRSGGMRKGAEKEARVGAGIVGANHGGVGEPRKVSWGPVQVQGQGAGDGAPQSTGQGPVPWGASERAAGKGEGGAEDEEGEGEGQEGGHERQEEEQEEGEEGEGELEEEEEEGEEGWEGDEGDEGGTSGLNRSGDSPFRFGEYFWQDDCCWLEEEPPEAFLSNVPSSVSLLLALQHITSAETVLLLTTGVPLLRTPSPGPSSSPLYFHEQGGAQGGGGGGEGAVGGGAPVAYQRPTAALAAADEGWEYAPRVCPDAQRSGAIGRALTACMARALPGVLRDLGVTSRAVSLHALEAALRELVRTFSLVLPLPSFSQAQWRLVAALFVHALSFAAFPGAAAALAAKEGKQALEKICREASCPFESYLSLLAFLTPSLKDGPNGPVVHPLPLQPFKEQVGAT